MPFPDAPANFVVDTTIEGIEVTQSLQYYRAFEHLTDALDRAPDNSLLLVPYKAAYVRVYLVPGVAAPTQNITGELVVTRYREGTPIRWEPSVILAPVSTFPAWADPNATYDNRRRFLGRSLNFLIPAATMAGHLQLEAQIRYTGIPPSGVIATRRIRIDVTHMQRLPVRGIFLTYNGPDAAGKTIKLAAPAMSQLQAVATDALAMYPVEATTRFSSAGQTTWSLPLTDNSSANCTPNWDALTAHLATVRALDGNRQDVVYYGLLPVGVPMGATVGCGGGGIGTGDSNGRGVFAHEVGHALGLAHAPSCSAGRPDPNYPAYEPYDAAAAPRGLIGEYGFDLRNPMVLGPSTFDFMGYCNPPWISLYTFRFLTQHARLVAGNTETRIRLEPKYKIWDPYRPKWKNIPDPPPSWVDRRWLVKPRPVVSITGSMRAGRVVDATVIRVAAVPIVDGQRTSFTATLYGNRGEELASGRLTALNLMPFGCGCEQGAREPDTFAFQVLLSDVAPGGRIAIHGMADGEPRELWAVDAPKKRPRVSNVTAARRGRAMAVRWSCEATERPARFSVQFSKDGGESWNACASLIDTERRDVPLECLPEGAVVFRVLAHDGFHTVSADSRRVSIPAAPPSVAVLAPTPNATLVSNEPMMLWAAALDQNGSPLPDDSYRWELDGKAIGMGAQRLIAAPPPGDHTARVVVAARSGRPSQSVQFTTVADA